MPPPELQYDRGGVLLTRIQLWLDPHRRQTGPERVFVSHAHSDHAGSHREAILTGATARLMRARGCRTHVEHILEYGLPRDFTAGQETYRVTLIPAGHMLGSAMAWIESETGSLLYTGDFKLRPGWCSEPCQTVPADCLIMETTFGRPEYRFPPRSEVMAGVIRFCREAIDNGEIPVLLSYSMGKSQELLQGLAGADLPILVHAQVAQMTRIYEDLGHTFPPYEIGHDAVQPAGQVVICPPGGSLLNQLRRMGKVRSAVLSGWAIDPASRYQFGCDAAFPLSDHADYDELVELVRRVEPQRVYTVHGFAADFARTLRDLGFNAQALSESEQLTFRLLLSAAPLKAETVAPRGARGGPSASKSSPGASGSFRGFGTVLAAIREARSKADKVGYLATYLAGVGIDDLTIVAGWMGRSVPARGGVGPDLLGEAVLRGAACAAAGIDRATFRSIDLKHSDLGETIAEVLEDGAEEPALNVQDVAVLLPKVRASVGSRSRIAAIAELFRRCESVEARALVMLLTNNVRIGLTDAMVEEAIAKAYGCDLEAVRRANLVLGDLGQLAVLAHSDRLDEAQVKPHVPVRGMLPAAEVSSESAWVRLGDSGPVWIDEELGGLRCQVHAAAGRVTVYSTTHQDLTAAFPELSESLDGWGQELILDGEITDVHGTAGLTAAELRRRLQPREDDLFPEPVVPVSCRVLDLLWNAGHSWLNASLSRRRAALEALGPWPEGFRIVPPIVAGSAAEIEAALNSARERGFKGLLIKDPQSPYVPACRGIRWLRLGCEMDLADGA